MITRVDVSIPTLVDVDDLDNFTFDQKTKEIMI